MAAQPQPNFLVIGRSAQALADQLSLLPNIPALDQGAEILRELRAIRGELDSIRSDLNSLSQTVHTSFARVELKLEVAEKNNVQRLINGSLSHPDMMLSPLYNPATGEFVNGFPLLIEQVAVLTDEELVELLGELGQDTEGRASDLRKRFLVAIGIVLEIG